MNHSWLKCKQTLFLLKIACNGIPKRKLIRANALMKMGNENGHAIENEEIL